MWATIELREIRVFLALAEELHFGRTAERVGLTQSRVSQSLRELEDKLGVQLIHRTTRRVTLTARGKRFRDEIGAAHGELADVLRRTHSDLNGVEGTVGLGANNATSVGERLLAVIEAFEAADPRCAVRMVELSFGDRLQALRSGTVDLMVTRLPVDEPELVVGPIVDREARFLAVARDHPLAGEESVTLEDIAAYDVGWADVLLPETSEHFIPSWTPSGRPIRRVRLGIGGIGELIVAVARGRVVHPTISSFASHYAHPQVRYLPITDLPPAETALVWRRRGTPTVAREFTRLTRSML